jgi:creatinine amidohydrolase
MFPSRHWADLATTDFAGFDAAKAVVLMPVAAIEQHGPHLPVSVDAVLNAGVLERALALLPAEFPLLVLPALTVGKSNEHLAFPGTLSLSAETLQHLWLDIAASVHRAGFRKLLLLNSHGGQPQIADIVVRELRVRHAMLAVAAHTYGFGVPEGCLPAEELKHGIHGGAVETAMMLHLRPDLVWRDAIANFRPASIDLERDYRQLRFEGSTGIGWQTQDLNPAGACGDARLATPELGRRIVEHIAQGLAELLREVSAFPLDALRPGPLPGP